MQVYYGPGGYSDQRGCDIRLAVLKGELCQAIGKDGK